MAAITTFALQSGSNGNCIFVEAGDTRLLIDAGISGRRAKTRLAERGRSIYDVDALLITHDHCDHAKHAGVYERLYKLPTYMTAATHERVRNQVGKMREVRRFAAGDTLEIGNVRVHSFSTPHDAVDGVAFVIEFEGKRLGVFTDLGRPFAALGEALAQVDAAYLESNYDPAMLAAGPYPLDVQRRISGGRGHLSNQQAADMLAVLPKRPQWIALSHLSEHNNAPDVALDTHLSTLGTLYPLVLTNRHGVSEQWLV